MKKILTIGNLVGLGRDSMVLAYKSGTTFKIQGMEFNPPERFRLEKTDTELIIRIQMNDSDILALESDPGMARKQDV